MTIIDSSAFEGCTSLESVTFGLNSSLETINYGAFKDCTSLSTIVVPDGVNSIGSKAFNNCAALTSVSIPSSVTHIGEYAFDSCQSLVTFIFRGTQAQWDAVEKASYYGYIPDIEFVPAT